MRRNRLVIGLLWHSVNSHNFGVGALTIANLAIIRRVASRMGVGVRFIIIGWCDGRVPYVSDPDITMVPLRPREHFLPPTRLAAEIRRCDAIFDIGYGDSFSDLYGVKRYIYFLVTKIMVLACRRPLVLSPQTIGPFRRRWVRLLARQVLKRADAVVARDRLSGDYLGLLGVMRNRHEAVDVAFELPAEGRPLQTSDRVRVGINISGLLYNGGESVARGLGLCLDYRRLAEELIAWFAARPECEVHLIGHVFADDPIEDDQRAIRELAARFPSAVVAPEFTSPTEAKGYIADMDFFLGSRMHACIAAFSSGVAVIPIAYSRKFAGLFGTLGYPYIADCTRHSIPMVVDRVANGFVARHRLRTEVEAAAKLARNRLAVYEGVVASTLEKALAAERMPARVTQPA